MQDARFPDKNEGESDVVKQHSDISQTVPPTSFYNLKRDGERNKQAGRQATGEAGKRERGKPGRQAGNDSTQ